MRSVYFCLHTYPQCMKHYRSLLSVSSASGPSLEPGTEDGDSLEANLVLLTVLGGVFLASSLETLQHRNHKTWIPESSLAVLAGLALGLIIRLSVASPPNNLVFNGEIFFLVALPVLIFDAGFSLRKKEFFGQLFTILVFSIVGTAGAAAIIGAILYAAGQAGASLKLDFNEAMAYGGVLSATDAMATASVLRGFGGVDPNLMALVLGEGALNDATSIVWYQIFAGFYRDGIDKDSPADASSLFFTELFASLFLGIAMSISATYFFRMVHMGWLPQFRHAQFAFLSPQEYYAQRVFELKEEGEALLVREASKDKDERKPFASAYSAVKRLGSFSFRKESEGVGVGAGGEEEKGGEETEDHVKSVYDDDEGKEGSDEAPHTHHHHAAKTPYEKIQEELALCKSLGRTMLPLQERRQLEIKPSSSVYSQTAFILLIAYVTYLLADSLHLSGVVAILFVGIGLNHFLRPLLNREGKEFSEGLVRVLAVTADTSVFFQVGLDIALTMGTTRGIDTKGDGEMVGWVLLAMLVSRTLTVFPIAFVVNYFRGEGRKIPWEYVVVLWYSSMRGAGAYAFSLVFPSDNRGALVDLTAAVVLISVLVYSTSMKFLLNCLGLRQRPHGHGHSHGLGPSTASSSSSSEVVGNPLGKQRSGRFLPTEADDSDEEEGQEVEEDEKARLLKVAQEGGMGGGPNYSVAIVQGVKVYLPKVAGKQRSIVKRALTFVNRFDSQLRWVVSGVVRS